MKDAVADAIVGELEPLQKRFEQALADEALPERILGENPRFFGAWALCADYREEVLGDREGARRCREEALRLEIPRLSERQEIERKLK